MPSKKISLSRTVAIALMVVVVLACTQASVGMITAYYSIDDGRAINYAGSLRMRSYQLVSIANSDSDELPHKLDQFELVLHSLKGIMGKQPYVPLEVSNRFDDVERRWDIIRQRIAEKRIVSTALEIRPFVEKIDLFVKALEQQARFKLMSLLIIQMVGILLLIGLTLYVMQLVRRNVTQPLSELERGAERMAAGDFDVIIPQSMFREFATFGATMGSAAKQLDGLYQQLEQRVEAQDIALKQAHDNLRFLYETSVHLQSQADVDLTACIEKLRDQLDAQFVSLELDDSSQRSWSVGRETKATQWVELPPQNGISGRLLVACSNTVEHEFLHSFVFLITQYLHAQEDGKRRAQVGLMEERAVIARELHDSLGQLLAYMKIQLSLLKRAVDNNDPAKITEATEQLQQSNDVAYKQLRELLTTFRLKLVAADLEQALVSMISQLQPRTEAKIVLDYQMPKITLEANVQVHLLQLLQEAVVNAIKHADANQIDVSAAETEERWQLAVSDDGVGMADNDDLVGHFGLGIMKERARRMGAELTIASSSKGGVKVVVSIDKEEREVHG